MADSQTPVGDWLRRRYPPNDGATHYLGAGDDPGCCAGPHPMCTYDAGFREGTRAEQARLQPELERIEHDAIARIEKLAEAVAAERERCAQLAEARSAEYPDDWGNPARFADLLREQSLTSPPGD